MSDKVTEILDILQEECGEVIVAISKCRRFGMDNSYKNGGTQREHLIQELGDATLLIDLLKANGVFTDEELQEMNNVIQLKQDKDNAILLSKLHDCKSWTPNVNLAKKGLYDRKNLYWKRIK